MRSQRVVPIEGAGHPSEAAVLTVRTFGKFELRVRDKEILIAGRKSRALLGYLALSDFHEESRERFVGLLWSESPEDKARASLRQAIYEIRDAFQGAGLVALQTDKLAIALDRTRVRVDLIDALEAAREGRPHPCLHGSRNPTESILGDLETVDPAFRTWLTAKRQTIHDQIMRHLERALRTLDPNNPGARDVASAIINLDATHEEACRFMIRALVADGEIGGALRIYKTLWDLLEDEYDVEPTQETQDLIAQIKAALPFSGPASPAGSIQGQARGNVVAARSPVRLASVGARANIGKTSNIRSEEAKLVLSVGPFHLAGVDPEKDYLAQGFRRELIACLVRFREWLVRNWVQNGVPGEPESADDEYVLDASGYETQHGIHFVLTLRDGGANTYLWSERLTLTLENWHQLQQSLVRRIATALNVHVSAERMNRVTKRPDVDLKAYDIWLFGQATLLGLDPERWDKAAELFRQVVQRMPDFAPAFSSLAQLNNSYHIVNPGVRRNAQRTEQALAYAREAVRLDPVDSRSHLCLGWSHAMSKHYDQAMIYIPLAHDLNDNDPWTLVSAANCFAFCGMHAQAVAILDHILHHKTFAPTPLQWAYQTATRFMSGEYELCVEAADSAGDLNPNVPGFKAAALYHLGQRDAAAAELQRFFTVVGDRWVARELASADAITRWFLHMFPIARPEDWARLRDGVAGAGAPTSGLFHHQW